MKIEDGGMGGVQNWGKRKGGGVSKDLIYVYCDIGTDGRFKLGLMEEREGEMGVFCTHAATDLRIVFQSVNVVKPWPKILYPRYCREFMIFVGIYPCI